MYLGLIPRGETRKVWKKSTSFNDLGVKAGFKLLMVTDNGVYNMVIVMVVARTVKTMILSQLMYLVIPGVLVSFPKQDVVPHSTGLLKFKRTHHVNKNRWID